MNKSRRLQDMEDNALILTRGYKKSALKYDKCGKTGHKKETCYKIHPKLHPRQGGNGGNYVDNANTALIKAEKLKIEEGVLDVLITTNKSALSMKHSPDK